MPAARTPAAASWPASACTGFGEGNIYPHEETMSGPKQDRLLLTRACKANLSQIFGLYPDPTNEVQNKLEAAVVGVAPLEATDHLGVVHRLWPVTDLQLIGQVESVFRPSRSSSPTATTAMKPPATTATNWRPNRGLSATIRPITS